MSSVLMFTDDGVSITHLPLHIILREAFRAEDDQIVDEPDWARSALFDIEANVAPEDAPKLKDLSGDQRFQMLAALLADRFGLKFHHESRELPVYTLVVARGGEKMQSSKPNDPSKHGWKLVSNGQGHIDSESMSMSALARMLSQQLGHAVVDKTGLTGKFDFKLDWMADDAASRSAVSNGGAQQQNSGAPKASWPPLFTALEEQLGLKLTVKKVMSDVIVIDHIEPPSAN